MIHFFISILFIFLYSQTVFTFWTTLALLRHKNSVRWLSADSLHL
jgi:hypothetical protein